nr:hypothetical protein CFP56_10104 [Quercus suber]
MGKRKRTHLQSPAGKKQGMTTGIPSPPNERPEATSVHALLLPEDIEITVETLQTLARNPSVIKTKTCKDVRTAVHGFRQACTTGLNAVESTSLTSCISGALTDEKYTDVLVALYEMRIRCEIPALGALCRWVRSLDVVSGLSDSQTIAVRSEKNVELLRVLDSILRLTGPIDINPAQSLTCSGPIALQETWNPRTSDDILERPLDDLVAAASALDSRKYFRVLETIAGADRKPPNLYPAILYTSEDDTISLSRSSRPTGHSHPVVPNLRVINSVLSPEECASIIAVGESVAFVPDAPIRDDGDDTSVLAHNFYWVVDQAFHDQLWQRVSPFVPEHVSGRKVRGINRRFRVYRYVPGAEYRCHIDGAWPPSGIDAITGKYVYDASSKAAKQSSLFTFLIYLNDNFKGGETTFFMPGVREGVLNAYPVKPIMGSVAVFPHGETQGALLHEGTGVIEGAKYVIRTDVEYDVDATGS